jgi:hypothetical protein
MENVIKTSDLYFAAFLQSAGCKIVKTDKEGSKNIFHFQNDQNRDLQSAYFNEGEESKIPALKFANAVRSLKTMVYVRN